VAGTLKKVRFWGDSYEQLTSFPKDVRKDMGRQLFLVQCGAEPADWKPMAAVGAGVREIRIRDLSGAYRMIYVAKIGDQVIVLHCFQKKTQKTSRNDLDVAKRRYKDAIQEYAS